MNRKNSNTVRVEGIESLEDFLEIFEAFATDVIDRLDTLSRCVQATASAFDRLKTALTESA
jgi:hypothetical protein